MNNISLPLTLLLLSPLPRTILKRVLTEPVSTLKVPKTNQELPSNRVPQGTNPIILKWKINDIKSWIWVCQNERSDFEYILS